ncbi:MAG TPA: sulfite exporter TauE/SafE family protein [Gemmatimonadales bacterium]|nr:sulfite exporter TauE/SafE family protein [Gemmatimonadales bacterium]
MRSLLILGLAFTGALLGSLSGGSASALTTPAWLAMGVPLPTAVATDKLAGALWTLLGARNYLRNRPVDWRLLAGMTALGLAGAWFGAAVTVRLDPALLKRVVGAMILLLIGVMLLRPRLGAAPHPPRASRWTVGAAALPLGFYEGMLGSGNSLVSSLLFCWGRGYDLIGALGHYYVLAFAWCALAAAAYIGHGYYDVALMVPATLGSCSGGYLGSRIGSQRGTAFVRGLFVVVGSALGLKLVLNL